MSSTNLLSLFAAKVLGFDKTELPKQQFAMIQDVLANYKVPVRGNEAKELLGCLKRKHLVNSISLRQPKKGLVFSSSGNGSTEVKSGESILDYVNKNFVKTDVLTMRTEKEWVMLLPSSIGTFVVKANSSLSPIELRVLAKDVEKTLKKKKFL